LANDTYVHCGYDKEQLKDTIRKVTAMPASEIAAMQARANDFARENFSYKAWKDAVAELER
jgi:hypothetical protein